MKTKSKALLLTLCAVLLVAASVLGTMAYLTSTDKVENTFTVGNVAITLDETKVDLNGDADATATGRVKANTYKLMPGHTYTKDPIVHVADGSENSYIFVKVENGIAAFEAGEDSGYAPITKQMENLGWKALEISSAAGVYYKVYDPSKTESASKELTVFNNFKIAGDANTKSGWGSISAENTKVIVNAYAVQQDGFTTAEDAWTATFGSGN